MQNLFESFLCFFAYLHELDNKCVSQSLTQCKPRDSILSLNQTLLLPVKPSQPKTTLRSPNHKRQPKKPHTAPDNHTQPQRQGDATNPEHPETPRLPRDSHKTQKRPQATPATPASPNNPKQPKQLNPRNSDPKQTQNSKQK